MMVLSTSKEALDWIHSEGNKLKAVNITKRGSYFTAIFVAERKTAQQTTQISVPEQVKWWLIQQLGRQGWEPFAVLRSTVYLRRETVENSEQANT
jgi:hypothetical protein